MDETSLRDFDEPMSPQTLAIMESLDRPSRLRTATRKGSLFVVAACSCDLVSLGIRGIGELGPDLAS